MTPVRAAAAMGFPAAVSIALVAAASGFAVGWPQASLSCLPCIPDALYNQYGIPGAIFGVVTAVVVTTTVLNVGGLFGVGVVARQVTDSLGVTSPAGSAGNEPTTYIPGISPVPAKGDLIYFPSQGASKVTGVYTATDDFGTVGIVVVTELGIIGTLTTVSERSNE